MNLTHGDLKEISRRTGISFPTVKDRIENGEKPDLKYNKIMEAAMEIAQEREGTPIVRKLNERVQQWTTKQ